MIHSIVISLGSAVVVAGVLALATIGFTVRYAVSGVFDLTYGALLGAAMLIAYLCTQAGVNLWISVLVAGVSIGVVSVLIERLVVLPMAKRGATAWVMMIITFAIGLAIESTVLGTWGPGFNSYPLVGRTYRLSGVIVTTDELWIILIAFSSTAIIGVFLRFTQWGRAMRGTASNSSLAENCGIQVRIVKTLTWFLSGVLCGAGGVLVAIQISSFTYSSWEQFFPLVIAAAIVGGVGRIGGAFVGGLLIGLVTALASALISSAYEDVIALGCLIAVLMVRPRGILVRAT